MKSNTVLMDIHATGNWAVVTSQGKVIPETVEHSGYSAKAAAVRVIGMSWSRLLQKGFQLVRLHSQFANGVEGIKAGLDGRSYCVAGNSAISRSEGNLDEVQKRMMTIELAFVTAGFDIEDAAFISVLQTIQDAFGNEDL